jgi:ribosomal 50S subunit-recycling heat shock protein
MDTTRVDRWVWAIRLYKTRTDATDACRGGHVRVNGKPAKPATHVSVGDRVTARAHGIDRDVEVRAVIDKRVGATAAAASGGRPHAGGRPRARHRPPHQEGPAADRPVAAPLSGSGRH